MRKALTAAAVFAAALTISAGASAQTGPGVQVDNNAHPNVGALLRQRTDGSLTITCSGTLVSYHVFLTAGHCSDFLFSLGQTTAYVTFDPNRTSAATSTTRSTRLRTRGR